MSDALRTVLDRHLAGEHVGITSVCSAHPLVLRAAAEEAAVNGSVLLVEATSNQVDQFGGYTGMLPSGFRDLVHSITERAGLPREQVVLGGDHLGPNTWRALPADEAMRRSEDLVAAYVQAGYTKIHLDCTYPCATDSVRLTDEIVADRAARLAVVAETAAVRAFGRSDVRYVIGTEVPVPGGAHEMIDRLTPTSPGAARATLDAHEQAFARVGARAAWDRVCALVVQPGVEFDAVRVVDYDRTQTTELSRVLEDRDLVFEAHSTDYQTVERLSALVEDHWAVLKVGPGLTFALREVLFGLAEIEAELLPAAERSALPDVIDAVMVDEPRWWKGYYEGDEDEQRIARRYSYSDRLRYYWPTPRVTDAVERLMRNLRSRPVPLPVLSAHLPKQYERVRDGLLTTDPEAIALDHVRDVCRTYDIACNPRTQRGPSRDRNAAEPGL